MSAGFRANGAFGGFSVRDTDAAARFYRHVLGLEVSEESMGILRIGLGGEAFVIAYPKPDHTPATFTILNFPVDDVEAAVDELVSKGLEMQRYEGMSQDDKAIMRGEGPEIAWFLDPSDNVLAVLEDDQPQ